MISLEVEPNLLVQKFFKNDKVKKYQCYGNGHINSTFLFELESGKVCIVQKINHNIFKNVDMLMTNIDTVTKYLEDKGIETLRMLFTDEGKNYVEINGSYYRMYEFLKDTITVEKADNLKMVEVAAAAFGRFHNNLAGLDGSKLGETIVNFHNTKSRYQDFLDAVKRNATGRVSKCEKEIEDVKKYAEYYSMIVDAIDEGEVKLHVTHNDPKINNALFDSNTHKFRSIIDLDTVMPGSVLYDFGDALRSLMTGDREDSLDYEAVKVDFDIFRHYLKAYYAEAKHFLTKKEIELIPYAPFMLTMECGMRFLADYIDGDKYFHVTRENHNLDRARTQINLAESIMNNVDELKKITEEITK